MEPTQSKFCATVQHSDDTPVLPTGSADLRGWLERERCVVFRGFDATVNDFEQITGALSDDFHTYRGGGFTVGKLSRSTVNNNKTLMTATGTTQDFPMPLHGEMYYLSQPPDLIWFYCQNPVAEGGQTTVGDAQQIFADLSPATQALFHQRRILYERRIADGDWQLTFQAETRKDAETFCRSQGMDVVWEEDGTAVTRFHTSALRTDEAGKPAFINSLLLLAVGEQVMRSNSGALLPDAKDIKIDFVVRWDDGSPIEPAILQEIAQACSRNEIEVSWQRGDIILVDNRSVMHGRRGSSGKDRKILVRMANLKKAETQDASAA